MAKKMVSEGMAACANIFPIKSVYMWKGKMVIEKEAAILFKTGNSGRLISAIRKIHPYEVPCIVAWKIVKGNKDYLSWLSTQSA